MSSFYTTEAVRQWMQARHLARHQYLAMHLIMVMKKPVATFVSSLAASAGYFNIYLVLLLSRQNSGFFTPVKI